ncbi:MAG: hypothetical protein D6706_02140 [Chloroflexi bacterium]|nr:MAG: hypothetical protein D6706_02140 [Chloroflexota bacterium]
MKNLYTNVLKFVGVLFAILVLGFTGFQTWNLLYSVSFNPLISVLGLVLFEGGMLYWWGFFQHEAEGLPQMALSLLAAVFGLFLVGGATALHLGAVDAATFGEHTPAKLVTIAAVVNLVAKFLMPLLHPDVMKAVYKRALTGRVLTQTFGQFETKVAEMAATLADEVARDWTEELRHEILTLQRSKPLSLPAAGDTAAGEPVVIPVDADAAGGDEASETRETAVSAAAGEPVTVTAERDSFLSVNGTGPVSGR